MTTVTDRVTLQQVADLAEVSVPTVSKVLNGHDDIAAETRQRIESAIAQTGYQRRHTSRRTGGLIDLVFGDLSPWSVDIIRGAEEAALHAGLRVAVSVAKNRGDIGQWINSVERGNTDGVILTLSDLSDAAWARLRKLKKQIVVIDPVGQPEAGIPSIGSSNWAGGMQATEHLLTLGHRRIATITGRIDTLCAQARLDGYRAALARAGVDADPALVAEGDFRFESALTSAGRLLELDDPPTAIIAASDVQAMGVYEAARRHGLRIPDDLSVVGFDDIPSAGWMAPPLTTVRQPLAEMASLAVKMLVAGNSADYNNRAELSTNLVVRASTASPR
ncbi:substrate-binding domain-containing protein [Planctomonas sp. JC2975]|uniref:LacI family DNA-binding transcriptional regulator n=1 Tax=Planctomonas sp. JC2975 TaxID=2729626 RepID=UPI0014731427|nr:substrate-binding domain-containing protein [Planctomonas sp. JC2975]NNC12527.1 substrate-binding domain-containing protein [Planctomonas sp. JC2975]